jgi:2-oxoglutarate dehydrogenase E2 component (dihydrolipoamide succinyltransferase)
MDPNREQLDAPLSPPVADAAGVDAPALAKLENDVESDDVGTETSGGDAFATQSRDTAVADPELANGEPQSEVEAEDVPRDAADTLSPAVRRLVRQYDLDITGIHGTGPSGRIRVGDVIGMLGGRADGTPRAGDSARAASTFGDETIVEAQTAGTPYRRPSASRAPAMAAEPPVTTVYECDLSRVLTHRKARRRNNVETLLTSYYLVACGEALRAVPEVVAGDAGTDAQLGVLVASADGDVRTTLVDAVDTINDSGPLAPFDDRLGSFDQALRAIGDASLSDASLLIHHYGSSGSVLATPTPRGAGHVASVGVGRVRREIVIKAADGDQAPRVAAMCYVTLTFLPDRLPLNRANRFVAQLVRVLEHWPE